jgi:hypothetical protein
MAIGQDFPGPGPSGVRSVQHSPFFGHLMLQIAAQRVARKSKKENRLQYK